MRAFVGKSVWVKEEGLRLEASTYASGGLEARDKILKSGWNWKRLDVLCDIFNGPRFVRSYVRDPKRGIPFLSSSDMLLADPQGVPFLSLKNTSPVLMEKLTIRTGWTLISCSGTIGRTVFVRSDMEGMTASQHVMRTVIKDPVIWPGYLFAFLTSSLAQSMIKQKTYGNVIQHIEPQHIGDLPVPLPDDIEQQCIHNMVMSAARDRTEASNLFHEVEAYFDSLIGPMSSTHDHAYMLGVAYRSKLNMRLDAFHHIGWAVESNINEGDRIADLAVVISTNRVPRIYVKRGIPFLSGIDIFQMRPTARVRLATYIADRFGTRVKNGDIAIQGSGQRYGLVGRAAYIGNRLDGWAASHDLFRIRTSNIADTARIYAFLRSDSGHRAMLRHSYGTSIPHVNPDGIASVCIPPLPSDLTAKAVKALQLIEQADADEEQAIRKVEQWLNSLN
jgi:type I restriction enzyme, S subunit